MSDEDLFLEEMQRHPGDKNSRLIYADWLEERGDPRGPLNRLIGLDATWYCGHDLRKSALDAMHFAWDTRVRVFAGSEYYIADATRVFHEFAIWIAVEILASHPDTESHPAFRHFQALLGAKMAWVRGQLSSDKLQRLIDQNRSSQNPAFTAIRLAANTTSLSAAKHTSRFAQKSRLESVSLPRQDFQLTQMLIDRCQWRRE